MNILIFIFYHSNDQIQILEGFTESPEDGFNHASDMIVYIRENYGDYFCLGIAAFPKGHPSSNSMPEYMEYLKYKVDAGTDFIITQMFYNSVDFKNLVKYCENIGIHVPILPGVCMFPSYKVLKRMTELTQLSVSKNLEELVENVKDENEAFLDVMRNFVTNLINELLEDEPNIPGIHWFTFNNFDEIIKVLNEIDIFNKKM